MSKITNRDTAFRDGASVEDRLARLLDTPSLARVVPHLAPETLHQLIRHRGLDACGELVASATPAQLRSLLDLDLWRHTRPGRDDQFDVDRFAEWLEVLVDSGDAVAARTIAALDKQLVVAGLSRHMRVFDPGIFEPTAQSDDEAVDRHDAMREGDSIHANSRHGSGSERLECEIGGYIVRARTTHAWDAIVALLLALDAGYPDDFHALMRGCRRVSNSRPELSGFDDLLMVPEQHLHDVTIERERRQSQRGYATPADARAFLEMARRPAQERSGSINPIVAAYFRAAEDETPEPSDDRAQPAEHTDPVEGSASVDAVVQLLVEGGVIPASPRALLEAAETDPGADSLARLRQLMAYAREKDEGAYLARGRELAFLANTLLAGCSIQSRPFTPREASDAAAAICNLGLEHWPARDAAPPQSLLVDRDLVSVFEAGWSTLHHEVGMFVADQLIATLNDLGGVDREVRLGLAALRRALVKQRDAGTPWRARDAAEILTMLDTTAWIGVCGLLDECPVIPAAMTAILDGRTTTVSATEFEFISTAAQIEDVRTFMRRLPGVLAA
jgi:hypothetical protein